MSGKDTKRIAYIDWLRGFACLMMFQTHCYDSWLGGEAHESGFIKMSQLGGTLPAPLFLFLAGVSFALVTDSLRKKTVTPDEIARTTILRGGEIFLLALLFRLQEFLLGMGHAPWTDLLRVDILNTIGISLMLMGVACRVAAAGDAADLHALRKRTVLIGIVCAIAISSLTPLTWTSWQPHWRAWWLESYLNGVHIYGTPQPWLFPLFPWAAFAFAGLAIGTALLSDAARRNEFLGLTVTGLAGIAVIATALWLDARPWQLYPVYDFWHTSPNFFFVRAGIVMVLLFASYLWCRWGPGEWGFSPLIELGKSSLLVYWVHIELVYGGFSIMPKRSLSVGPATVGLIIIFVAMTLLATLHNRLWPRRAELVEYFRRVART